VFSDAAFCLAVESCESPVFGDPEYLGPRTPQPKRGVAIAAALKRGDMGFCTVSVSGYDAEVALVPTRVQGPGQCPGY